MVVKNIYFIGIGGIGMSALARYFIHEGYCTAGYDRTPGPITDALTAEGAHISFTDQASGIPHTHRDPADTLVVYTPAIPRDNEIIKWFREHGFILEKRSEMLGHIAEGKYVMAVAGTHGKTTVTSMTAWFNHQASAAGHTAGVPGADHIPSGTDRPLNGTTGSIRQYGQMALDAPAGTSAGASEGSNTGTNAVSNTGARAATNTNDVHANKNDGTRTDTCTCAGTNAGITANTSPIANAGTRSGTVVPELIYGTTVCPEPPVCPDAGGAGSIAAHAGSADAGPGSAFLGGIAVNFDSNLVLGQGNRMAVEADEFDRSFLRLFPDVAVITSTDADHLDIYGSHDSLKESFAEFVSQIKPGGTLIVNEKVNIPLPDTGITVYSYSLDGDTQFRTANLRKAGGGRYTFDIVFPDGTLDNCTLGVPGRINVENAVAACALLWVAGFDRDKLREAIASYRGVKRRFEVYLDTPQVVYIDDYAHHPGELTATLTSLREIYPGRRITAIFQPHLYTRTRDFHEGFSAALSIADQVILCPIYPARELPIEGIGSELIAAGVTVPCIIVDKGEIAQTLSCRDDDVVVTFGAGDIDRHCKDIFDILKTRAR